MHVRSELCSSKRVQSLNFRRISRGDHHHQLNYAWTMLKRTSMHSGHARLADVEILIPRPCIWQVVAEHRKTLNHSSFITTLREPKDVTTSCTFTMLFMLTEIISGVAERCPGINFSHCVSVQVSYHDGSLPNTRSKLAITGLCNNHIIVNAGLHIETRFPALHC